ncbi:MAG: DUF4412 domain-containing protein [Bacteroidota bacterium]
MFYNSLVVIILLINVSASSNYAQSKKFEGEIVFVKETLKDTSYFSYKIKGNKVRVDELDRNLNTKNYMIIDINTPVIYAVNPSRKLYTNMPVRPWNYDNAPQSNFQIIKTENYKYLNGYKCNQWRVRNKKENTEIAYWVASDQFTFFQKLLRIINIADKNSDYYLRIPETEGIFPMLSVEMTILRSWKSKLEVIKVDKKNMETALFEIPADYNLFQKN